MFRRFAVYLLLAAVLTAPLVACVGSATIDVSADTNFTTLTVGMTEADVQRIFESVVATGEDAWLLNPKVDLRPGSIFLTGNLKGDGTTTTPASLAMRVFVQNGQLGIVITSYNLGPWNGSPDSIQSINKSIAEGLQKAAADDKSGSQITAVTITNDKLTVVIKTPRRKP